jgi:hypothetical protein
MKKNYKIAAFIVAITIIAITLTSGIKKDYSRSGGYKDLVEELYDQAVKQNDNLESIEDGVEKFYKTRTEAIEKYNSYTSYNNRYYTDAKANAAIIIDPATKQRAYDLISKSETAYKAKIANWQNTIAVLNANEKELNDLHVLLEIMIADTMIEKYQNAALPGQTKLKETNADLLKVIEKIKAITK